MSEAAKVKKIEKVLFISDAHMGGFSKAVNDEIETALIDLVDYAEQEELKICFLGDIFDYWMEIRGTVPQIGHKLVKRLREYHQHQPATLFITGNHDNWTENYLKDFAGCDLESEFRILDLEGKKTLVLHGDGLKNPDMKLSRPRFHRFLRNPYFILFYKSILPAKLAIYKMKIFSRWSRFTGNEDKNNSTVIRLTSWAKKNLEDQKFDAIVCGHTHHARLSVHNGNTYLNLGNFYKYRTVGLFADGKFHLAQWLDSTKQLVIKPI